MVRKFFSLLVLLCFLQILSGQPIRVLFVGNSYTAVNNLPSLFQSIAASTGDEVQTNSNTPGGCTFQLHCSNQSASLIQQGGWDYVVLQEQSQLPAFPLSQVQSDCFPYAAQLNGMIEQYNPCAETVFYMTWGRKYGDQDNAAFFPPLATYEGMDSLLYERYMYMTQQNNSIVSPVGRVWRYIRTNHPEIDLYSSDNSHPSVAGSYAAACAFYTTILRKDPTHITEFCGLNQNVAQIIQNAVKTVVFDQPSTWYIGERALYADFQYQINSGFSNTTQNTNSTTVYQWNFGNGDFSTEETPTYSFTNSGIYTVSLTATDDCGQSSTISKEITVSLNIDDFSRQFTLYPNPCDHFLTISNKMNDMSISVSLFDISGKLLVTKSTSESQVILNMEDFSNGIYVLKVSNSNGIYYNKIIVK